MYKLIYSPQAQKDAKKIASSNLKRKVEDLLGIIKRNPYSFPPSFEFLSGKLTGFISRRINKQHRLIYKVLKLTGRFDKPLKRLKKHFFVSVTHDLSRGLLNNRLKNLTVSTVF